MRTVNVKFEYKDFKRLEAAKKKSGLTWEAFFLLLADSKEEKKNNEDWSEVLQNDIK